MVLVVCVLMVGFLPSGCSYSMYWELGLNLGVSCVIGFSWSALVGFIALAVSGLVILCAADLVEAIRAVARQWRSWDSRQLVQLVVSWGHGKQNGKGEVI